MKNRIVDYKCIRQMRRSSRWICGGYSDQCHEFSSEMQMKQEAV